MANLPEVKKPSYAVALYDKKIKDRFLDVVDEKTYNREIIFAKQVFDNNSLLQKCSPESIRNAIVNVALIGTSLNPALQEAYLVPRGGRACLDMSYKGLIGIACSMGNVKSMTAQVVYEWDSFEYDQGTNPYIHYKMCLNPPVDTEVLAKDPKKIWDHVVCAYSTATLLDGSVDFVIMPKYKIWKIYQSSQAKNGGPWLSWPEEMMRKTVVKYHAKTLPKQANERLATAVSILNEHEGLAPAQVVSQAGRLEDMFDDPEVIDAIPEEVAPMEEALLK